MIDDTKIPDGWPPGYRFVTDTTDDGNVDSDDCNTYGFARDRWFKAVDFAHEPFTMAEIAKWTEVARVAAWAHYATTREAELERRVVELERENASIRHSILLVLTAVTDRVKELEDGYRNLCRCFGAHPNHRTLSRNAEKRVRAEMVRLGLDQSDIADELCRKREGE